jgi:hypothetical protein
MGKFKYLDKKEKTQLGVTILTILVLAIGVTYSFFAGVIGKGAFTNVDIVSQKTDQLRFTPGDPISIVASLENFGEGKGNLSGTTIPNASLTANNTTKTASEKYQVYFLINKNEYKYSTVDKKPELILTVTDPTGAEVTTINGLTHVTAGGVTGFDITEYDNFTPIQVASDYVISSTDDTTPTVQNWTFKVTFINLGTDQEVNEGKAFAGQAILQQKVYRADDVVAVDIDANMIPIMYTETCSNTSLKDSTNGCWVKADAKNQSDTYEWYNYGNHKWANAVTLKSDKLATYQSSAVGTPIDNADVMGYFVYIPRYSYKLFNVNNDGGTYSNEQEILINFENKNTTKSTGSTNGTYLTHPAFTFGTTELNGFWIGKFETSYGTSLSAATDSTTALAAGVTVKPSTPIQTMYSLRYMTDLNFYNTMKSLSNGGGQAASNHNLSSLESSMLTNMQWGAAAYLTESVYGTCTGTKGSAVCTAQPQINSVSTYQTGCGPQSAGSTSSGTTCNYYNTTIGKLASTTQNIYGVYDMNGGAWERVMALTYDTTGTVPYYSSSGFAAGTMPDAKYYDIYTYGTTNNDATAYTRGKLGDATKEVVKSSGSAWYGLYAYFPSGSNSWFVRGGLYNDGTNAGILSFTNNYGGAYSDGSSRSVLH